MIDQRLSADAQILGNLGIIPALSFAVVNERVQLRPVMLGFRHTRTS
jgi:hypothetical protein